MTHVQRLGRAMQRALPRLLFALLSTAVVVVFSEKMYWYVTGYDFAMLIVGYFLPTYAFLTIVDTFHIKRLAPLFLAAAVFGYLVEGVIVPIIYENGPLSWFSLSYTPLAWHAPLSILFGWYSAAAVAGRRAGEMAGGRQRGGGPVLGLVVPGLVAAGESG